MRKRRILLAASACASVLVPMLPRVELAPRPGRGAQGAADIPRFVVGT